MPARKIRRFQRRRVRRLLRPRRVRRSLRSRLLTQRGWTSPAIPLIPRPALTAAIAAIAAAVSAAPLLAQPAGRIIATGENALGQCDPPIGLFVSVAVGPRHALALRPDGTLAAWGADPSGFDAPPAGVFLAAAAGRAFSVAIRPDGSLLAWGTNAWGELNIPAGTFSAVAAGNHHALALRSDGTLAAWGYNAWGQTNAPPGTFTSIACGNHHSLAVRSDGAVLAWGLNASGQCNVPPNLDAASVHAGAHFSFAVTPSGELVAWGDNAHGQLGFPAGVYAAADGGYTHALALDTQGLLTLRGDGLAGQTEPFAGFALAAAAGDDYTVILTADCNGNGADDALDIARGHSTDCDADGIPDECRPPAVVIRRHPSDLRVRRGAPASFSLIASPRHTTFRWRHNGVPLDDNEHTTGTRTPHLSINPTDDEHPGVYDCVISLGSCGSVTSAPATLTLDGASCPPDFNADGFLDFFDLDAFVLCFEAGDCPPGSDADFNGDGFVDFFDLDAFIAAFEDGC